MSNRQDFMTKMRGELQRVDKQIEVLQEKTDGANVDLDDYYNRSLQTLRDKRRNLQHRIDEAQAMTDEEWQQPMPSAQPPEQAMPEPVSDHANTDMDKLGAEIQQLDAELSALQQKALSIGEESNKSEYEKSADSLLEKIQSLQFKMDGLKSNPAPFTPPPEASSVAEEPTPTPNMTDHASAVTPVVSKEGYMDSINQKLEEVVQIQHKAQELNEASAVAWHKIKKVIEETKSGGQNNGEETS